jgi:hypothetical protein
MKRLILTSSSGATLSRTGLADLVIPFTFRFVWGPLPSPDELAFYVAARSDKHGPGCHWSDYMDRRRPDAKACKHLALVECCEKYDVVELWFDPAAVDQLLLIWLLDYFRSQPTIADRLRLRLVDFDLIMVGPKGLGRQKVPDSDVTEREFTTASLAWQAYRAPTPEACFDLLGKDLSALPLLKPVLLALLEELPSGRTGLGATEMRFLELIARGYFRTNGLFYLRGLRQRYVFSEWEMGFLLEGLAHGPKPAVAGLDEELRTLSRENYRDRETAYRRSELTLTEFGKSVLAHEDDFSRHNPIDRWWGGTRLTNDRMWRWNPVLIAPR